VSRGELTPCVYGHIPYLSFMVRQLPGFLTLKEAAERAGLSPITLRIQIRNGRIKATKVGRDWVITRDELRAYLKSVGK
jgi:excisionase family DNA binding protein